MVSDNTTKLLQSKQCGTDVTKNETYGSMGQNRELKK